MGRVFTVLAVLCLVFGCAFSQDVFQCNRIPESRVIDEAEVGQDVFDYTTASGLANGQLRIELTIESPDIQLDSLIIQLTNEQGQAVGEFDVSSSFPLVDNEDVEVEMYTQPCGSSSSSSSSRRAADTLVAMVREGPQGMAGFTAVWRLDGADVDTLVLARATVAAVDERFWLLDLGSFLGADSQISVDADDGTTTTVAPEHHDTAEEEGTGRDENPDDEIDWEYQRQQEEESAGAPEESPNEEEEIAERLRDEARRLDGEEEGEGGDGEGTIEGEEQDELEEDIYAEERREQMRRLAEERRRLAEERRREQERRREEEQAGHPSTTVATTAAAHDEESAADGEGAAGGDMGEDETDWEYIRQQEEQSERREDPEEPLNDEEERAERWREEAERLDEEGNSGSRSSGSDEDSGSRSGSREGEDAGEGYSAGEWSSAGGDMSWMEDLDGDLGDDEDDPHQLKLETHLAAAARALKQRILDAEEAAGEGTFLREQEEEMRARQAEIDEEMRDWEERQARREEARRARIRAEMRDLEEYESNRSHSGSRSRSSDNDDDVSRDDDDEFTSEELNWVDINGPSSGELEDTDKNDKTSSSVHVMFSLLTFLLASFVYVIM